MPLTASFQASKLVIWNTPQSGASLQKRNAAWTNCRNQSRPPASWCKACRETTEANRRHQGNRLPRRCHRDPWAPWKAWQRSRLRLHPGRMLRGGYRPSERRRLLNDSLSWQQDQALSSSIYLLRQMGPTGFLLREEEPENRDFRVTTAPNCLPSRSPEAHPRSLTTADSCCLARKVYPCKCSRLENVQITEGNDIHQMNWYVEVNTLNCLQLYLRWWPLIFRLKMSGFYRHVRSAFVRSWIC